MWSLLTDICIVTETGYRGNMNAICFVPLAGAYLPILNLGMFTDQAYLIIGYHTSARPQVILNALVASITR